MSNRMHSCGEGGEGRNEERQSVYIEDRNWTEWREGDPLLDETPVTAGQVRTVVVAMYLLDFILSLDKGWTRIMLLQMCIFLSSIDQIN